MGLLATPALYMLRFAPREAVLPVFLLSLFPFTCPDHFVSQRASFRLACLGSYSSHQPCYLAIKRRRVMNSAAGEYSGMVDCFRKSVAKEGPSSLMKGFIPAFARVGPRVVIAFVTMEQ